MTAAKKKTTMWRVIATIRGKDVATRMSFATRDEAREYAKHFRIARVVKDSEEVRKIMAKLGGRVWED
jgi:hypothetical protein